MKWKRDILVDGTNVTNVNPIGQEKWMPTFDYKISKLYDKVQNPSASVSDLPNAMAMTKIEG